MKRNKNTIWNFGIFRFVFREYLFETMNVLWAVIIIIISLIIIFSELSNDKFGGVLMFLGYKYASTSMSESYLNMFFTTATFLGIITYTKFISEVYENRRASLFFSKPFSRNNFILNYFIGTFLFMFGFYMLTGILLGTALLITTNYFPYLFMIQMTIFPLYLLSVCLIGFVIAVKFNNHNLSLLVTFVYFFLISEFLFNRNTILNINTDIIGYLLDVIYYLTPRIKDFYNMLITNNFNFISSIEIISSLVPSILLVFWLNNKKEL